MSSFSRNLALVVAAILLMTATFCYAGQRLTSDTFPIRKEVVFGGSYYHSTDDMSAFRFEPIKTEMAQFVFVRRHYAETRFANPSVPFMFIPYDYSTSMREEYVAFTRASETMEGLYDEDEDRISAGYGGKRYLDRHFFRGSIAYSRLTNPGRADQLEIQAGGGWHGSNLEFGLGAVALWEYNTFGRTYKWVGPKAHIDVTPSSFVRLSTSLLLLYDTGPGRDWIYELPVSLSYAVPESWWEFTAEFQYVRRESGYYRHTVGVTVRKYLDDHSVWVTGSHLTIWPDMIDHTFTNVGAGLDLVLRDRSVIVQASYIYGFGDSFYSWFPEDDGRDHSVELVLSLFRP